ncbi:hypothetical protein SADUNF_Sadunf15G0033700 [Salix dunnii]|uniref:Uncharacterized protein n=1 Tax=Salix dunnii TaxID=1413687 RepID=A0A835JFF7_9ROSI|nr:hypothetical protein SADUNF_Sadunf15G0033700 [Salix dunnii]
MSKVWFELTMSKKGQISPQSATLHLFHSNLLATLLPRRSKLFFPMGSGSMDVVTPVAAPCPSGHPSSNVAKSFFTNQCEILRCGYSEKEALIEDTIFSPYRFNASFVCRSQETVFDHDCVWLVLMTGVLSPSETASYELLMMNKSLSKSNTNKNVIDSSSIASNDYELLGINLYTLSTNTIP